MHQSHLPHSLLGYPADAAYYPQHYMPAASHYQHPGTAAAAASAGHHQQQHHYKSQSASGTPATPLGMWAAHSVQMAPATDLSGYFPNDYSGVGHHGTAVTMATLQPGLESAAALHQVPLFSNGYMFQQQPYMMSIQDQDSLLFSMQQDSMDQQQQQQHYAYPYGYPQHTAVLPTHQSAAYGVYASQHQQHLSQQSPPGGIDSAYPNATSSAAAYMTQAAHHDGQPQQEQQQRQSPIESSDGQPDQQQQQQSQQRRPKQHNTNQALEQISKLMLKLGDEEKISPEERQDRIRRYTDIALTIPVVWSYVCQLSELNHEAELGKVYEFLHHLAQCSVSADEWKQAVNEKSCVFSVVDGKLKQKVCPILRVQGRSPEKIETQCNDIKQKPSQRYKVQAKHLLASRTAAAHPAGAAVVDHASVLVIYPDTKSFEQVNSILHKLAFTKLCLGPDVNEAAAETAASSSAADDPVDAAKRKWESQLRPCDCKRALSLYAVPGKWQAYPLVADSQWELTRAEVGMSTTLSIKTAMPAATDAAAVATSAGSDTIGQLSDAAAAVALSPVAIPVGVPANAEAAAATAHYTGSPILAPHDVPTYQLCSLMDSAGSNPPPQQQQQPMPPQQPPNRIFKHQHPHQYHQHGQGGYAPYSMSNRRTERQTMPPRFARHVSQNAAYHEHDGPLGGPGSASAHHSQAHRGAAMPQPPASQPPPQHHHHHQDYRQSGPPSRSAIGRGGGGRGYGEEAPEVVGPAEFRLKENDFPEISADAAASAGNSGSGGGSASQGNNNSAPTAVAATSASSTHAVAATAASAGEASPEAGIGGASPEQSQQQAAGGGNGTSYAAALKKSVPPGSAKVATVSAAMVSAGDSADVPASPTSPSPAVAGVRRAVASAAQPASSTEASSDALTERDSGYQRGGNAWKASPATAGQQQRPSMNGTGGRAGRKASGSNA
uniref:RanBP2-type domain-containing protein n=1 Tax=Macrostomum lignano TaxID=282301 RepID=A0A1I8G3A0_9PLAT